LLANGAHRLLAVETDRRCIAALADLVEMFPDRLALVEADARLVDLIALAHGRGWPPPYRIVANLPYNVGTTLLIGWLQRAAAYESMTLMFQREVADRLTAMPASKDYGRLSVYVQWLCVTRRLFDISPKAFVPPPSIWSTVVRIEPRPRPLAEARQATLERVLAAAFNQRRKMLRGSLKALGLPPEPLLDAAGVAQTRRAEEIDVEGFCALARALDVAEGR
jgi:16S rRNA (adenine1518-N6/adenine1519-N6)-dimethyltransferase